MPDPAKRSRRLVFRRPTELTDADRDAMWAIVADAIQGDRPVFEQGLTVLDDIWLYEVAGVIRGFGGVTCLFPTWRGRSHCLIYTGRVYLHPSVRGHNVVQRVGMRCYMRRLVARPLEPVYWAFAAGSFKGYLMLPRNFRTYWPRPGATLPAREQALLHALGGSLDSPYDPETGIIRRPELVYLEGGLAQLPSDIDDPDVAFYARRNPGQPQGDVLLCLCPLTPANWATCLYRAIARIMRRLERPLERRIARAEDTDHAVPQVP